MKEFFLKMQKGIDLFLIKIYYRDIKEMQEKNKILHNSEMGKNKKLFYSVGILNIRRYCYVCNRQTKKQRNQNSGYNS